MKITRFSVSMPLASGLALLLAPVDLGAQMSFRDASSDRVVQEAADLPGAEKEVELGDFDRDGDLDAVIAIAGPGKGARRNRVYRNDGGIFREVTATVAPGFDDVDVSRNIFLRDYDDDGWLDLIVVNDSIVPGRRGQTRYYAAKLDQESFSHFEEETFRLSGAGGPACGAVSLDLDDDGTVDLYVGNYPVPAQDTFYLNDGSGFFADITATHVPPDLAYTSDVSAADLNGDGLPDILIGHE